MWFIAGLLAFVSITTFLFQHKSRPTWVGQRWLGGGDDVEFCVNRSKGRMVDVLVGVRAHADLQFTLRPEKWFDRLGKLLTLCAEYQVGDDLFDRSVYILSDSETVCRVLLGDARLRADLLSLISVSQGRFRVTHTHVSAGKLWVRMKPSGEAPLEEDALQAVAAIAPGLRAVEKRMRAVLKARPVARDRSFPIAAALAAISMGFAVNGGVAMIVFAFGGWSTTVVDHSKLLIHAAVVAVGIVGVLVLASLLLLGRTSRGHLVLTELLTLGLLGAFATSWIELREANLELDRSAPIEMSAQVLHKHAQRRKGGMAYTVGLRDWNGADTIHSFEVPLSTYDRVTVGQTMTLDQHAGRLGYRWVDHLRP